MTPDRIPGDARLRIDDALPGRGLALAAARGACRLLALSLHVSRRAAVQRRLEAAERLVGALLCAALDDAEKALLTIAIYDRHPSYCSGGSRIDATEDQWLRRHLPPPPARVLVGACGSGREAAALDARGHRVVAFDPAPRFVAECRRRLGDPASVSQLSYQRLSAVVLDGAPGVAWCSERFDAVLLGCGSLSHLLDGDERRRLLQALNKLCPEGPILASFSCADEGVQALRGRADRIGRRIGRAVAALRRLASCDDEAQTFRAHRGFACTFTPRRFEQLARGAGRSVAWHPAPLSPSPYATLLPPGATAEPP